MGTRLRKGRVPFSRRSRMKKPAGSGPVRFRDGVQNNSLTSTKSKSIAKKLW